jgi:GDPmannose 4,6-dehydratase
VEHQKDRIGDLPVDVEYGDLTDQSSLERALRMFKPDEIYNLGAQSHVRISSDIPQFTAQVNALGVINMLEAYRTVVPEARFYQASSSEMFGSSVDADQYQRETTPMRPVSPYGCTKVFAYNMVHHYRKAYKLHASNGILFNHESPRRGSNFVTNKVVKGAVEIALGLSKQLEMGNMDSYRDWGHSYDYVRAMHLIVQQEQPDDFVVATGITRSVRDMCEYVFGKLNLDYKQYVTQNPKYLRPEELPYLRGDNTKIVTQLGWKPTYSFEALMDEMIAHWQEIYSHKANTN